MKHLLIYENFDPASLFKKKIPGSQISVGDFVESYRGIGMVLDLSDEGLAEIELINSKRNKVFVPVDLCKIVPSEKIEGLINQMPETKKELKDLSDQAEEYLEINSDGDDFSEYYFRGNPERALDFLRDILIDLISLKSKDTFFSYYPEYSSLISYIGIMFDLIYDKIEDNPVLKNKYKDLESKYTELHT
jgi:hypothetical protein